jgi:nitrogen fixation/metabolism regulation signal transduction histidine kinase
MRRAGCFAVVALVVFFVALGAVIGLISTIVGSSAVAVLGALVLILVFVAVVRGVVREVRGVAAPVGDLIEASGRVEAGELDVQVPERGMREVRALTRAFNSMSARVSATERERRRLSRR